MDLVFSVVDVEEYCDYLVIISGLDMYLFFDDWIFSFGFFNYEIEELSIELNGEDFEVIVGV